MEVATAAELADWTDEALQKAYRDLACASELTAEECSFLAAVIGEKNGRASRKAYSEWLSGGIAYGLKSRRQLPVAD